ncbi:phage/plasmid primase, P4 family [Rhodobacteraceae bacterium]|nr:phage/plasmid primase, P4 family [Paracoccaceae bacterium]
MLDVVTDPSLCPLVTILEQGPRYTAEEISAAFNPKAAAQTKANFTKDSLSKWDRNAITPKVLEAVDYFKVFESDLWKGNWQHCEDPLTGKRAFPSQSEADYNLARTIAQWGAQEGISGELLGTFVEDVFALSALAQRDKWQNRADYRHSTVKNACAKLKLVSPYVPQLTHGNVTTSFALNKSVKPDWSLKGDLVGARFFADRHSGNMVYVASLRKWLRWDETIARWEWCELGEHIEAAKATVLELYQIACAHGATDYEGWKRTISAMASLQIESQIKSILELAKSEPRMSMLADGLDAHPEFLGVGNGVVDLRSGKLRANAPSLYITKYVNYDYSPTATCPLFKKFLADVFQGDYEIISAVHRLVGLTATGRSDEEIIIFCVGTGANGKSIFGNVLSTIMGQHSVTTPPSILAARRADDHSARSDIAMLHGARMVSINELPGGMTLDENVVKHLAGREPISARFLYKEPFTFLPRFTPWVRTNHRPIIKGTDNGIWRRLVIVPFRRTFVPEEQDNGLETRLMAEAEGVLAWIVEGAKLYLSNGLQNSRAMKSEVSQYRSDSDLLGEFLSDNTVVCATAEVDQREFYVRYKCWCEANGLRSVSKRVLNEQLTERGVGLRKSGATRYYTGVGLLSMMPN